MRTAAPSLRLDFSCVRSLFWAKSDGRVKTLNPRPQFSRSMQTGCRGPGSCETWHLQLSVSSRHNRAPPAIAHFQATAPPPCPVRPKTSSSHPKIPDLHPSRPGCIFQTLTNRAPYTTSAGGHNFCLLCITNQQSTHNQSPSPNMGTFDNLLLQLDEGVTGLFKQWNIWTSLIVTLFAGLITYQVSTRQDPDIHPFLLARQSQASPVRQPKESSVYRPQAAPHGLPLHTGLNVKDPGANKWARGRDGDLRDIWRQTLAGVQEGDDKGAKGRILTVEGTENVKEHHLDALTRQINLIGQHLVDQGGNRVAVYLPNSVELIVALFACAFYNLNAIILPFNQPDAAVIDMLRRSAADTVITAPGSFPFDVVAKNYPSLRQLVWVVDEGSKHMDWNEVPQGTGSKVNVATWQDIINDSPVEAGKTLPPLEDQSEPKDITLFWQQGPGREEEMVKFTTGNIVSAIAAQLTAIPTARRLSPSDLFLPADSLANSHTLVLTLTALFSNSSVAFNSSASEAPSLSAILSSPAVSPTVIAVTPSALSQTHKEVSSSLKSSTIGKDLHWLLSRSLAESGAFPESGFLTNYYNQAFRPKFSGGKKLRLVYTAERINGGGKVRLSGEELNDLRLYTGARVVYALTAARVAGAVCQTNVYDYRGGEHFGPPVASVEVVLRDKGGVRNSDEESQGEIVVRGPAVAGKEAGLGVVARVREDHTVALI
ncbi:hypothetical protein QC764_211450 [Podospora pseudoanserina]|uniref:AMP-dependent synthetase/ligase domain-containing protein n=1 Tax=Podospora pseudoanserina TaxID=2609844 RepID=A0ABR0IIP5_9PEZI|nr:hypothetical protein QC764_211450 [Podospora pseudoanserina]